MSVVQHSAAGNDLNRKAVSEKSNSATDMITELENCRLIESSTVKINDSNNIEILVKQEISMSGFIEVVSQFGFSVRKGNHVSDTFTSYELQ